MNYFLSKYFTTKATSLYFILLALCSVLFYEKTLPYKWIILGILEVTSFYYFVNLFSKKWNHIAEVIFIRKIFSTALIIRVVYVLVSYYFYIWMTGVPFEFDAADAFDYHHEALWILDLIESEQIDVYWGYIKGNYSDLGYVSYLSFIYYFFSKSVLLIRILKALLSTYSCILIYKFTKRNFGDDIARLAAISSIFLPNFIYYCGLHLKETEMTFLLVLFFERADFLILNKNAKPITLVLLLASGISLFFFRTALGLTAIISFAIAFLFSANGSINLVLSRKIIFSLVISLLSLYLFRGAIGKEIDKLFSDNNNNQSKSMQARAQRTAGNKLAVYGSASVFAPVMLIGPLPTLVNIETQQNQMLMNGGYFVRNCYVFFVFVGLYILHKRSQTKKYLLLLLFLFSYLGVIAFSKFAISERFHFPILPFIMILSAFGICEINSSLKKYYVPYLILVFLLIIGWNYFKLAGRE